MYSSHFSSTPASGLPILPRIFHSRDDAKMSRWRFPFQFPPPHWHCTAGALTLPSIPDDRPVTLINAVINLRVGISRRTVQRSDVPEQKRTTVPVPTDHDCTLACAHPSGSHHQILLRSGHVYLPLLQSWRLYPFPVAPQVHAP